MTAPTERPKRGAYTEDDFAPIFEGKIEIPNLELIDDDVGLGIIASLATLEPKVPVRHARIPGQKHTSWTRFFLVHQQWGGLDGTGYVVWYAGSRSSDYRSIGRIAKFQLCRHEKIEGPGADHRRGWHPGYCGKCGIDMSVDSGD